MSRAKPATHETFHAQSLAELCRQMRYTPEKKRWDQIARAEVLHDELEDDGNYPLPYVIYRITSFRPPRDHEEVLVGEALRSDLRQLIHLLTLETPCTPEQVGEDYCTVADLCRTYSITARTIQRWRTTGLRWRWLRLPRVRRPVVMVDVRALENFHERFPDTRSPGHAWEPVRDQERDAWRQQALTLSDAGETLFRAARQIAARFNRSTETVRLDLLQLQKDSQGSVFALARGRLSERDRRVILRAWKRGIAVGRLMERFDRSRPAIYHAIATARMQDLERRMPPFATLPVFERKDAAKILLPPPANHPSQKRSRKLAALPELPVPLDHLYLTTYPGDTEARHGFVAMHYLRYRAGQHLKSIDPGHPAAGLLDQVEADLHRAAVKRDELFRMHLPLVLCLTHRHLLDYTPHGSLARLYDLLPIAHETLLLTLEQFMPDDGSEFSLFLRPRLLRALTGQAGRRDDQAIRRRSPERVAEALIAQARAHGVTLEPSAATDAAADDPRS